MKLWVDMFCIDAGQTLGYHLGQQRDFIFRALSHGRSIILDALVTVMYHRPMTLAQRTQGETRMHHLFLAALTGKEQRRPNSEKQSIGKRTPAGPGSLVGLDFGISR